MKDAMDVADMIGTIGEQEDRIEELERVARMALGALEGSQVLEHLRDFNAEKRAITALRAALEKS